MMIAGKARGARDTMWAGKHGGKLAECFSGEQECRNSHVSRRTRDMGHPSSGGENEVKILTLCRQGTARQGWSTCAFVRFRLRGISAIVVGLVGRKRGGIGG